MPWIKDENGEDVYRPSMFLKEELPTWHEFYNGWYKKKLFHYSNDDTEMDYYWKVPKNYWLMARCCNQLNKMLWEGHGNPTIPMNDEILELTRKYIHDYFDPDMTVYNISFFLEPGVSGWYETPFEFADVEVHGAYSLPKILDSPFAETVDKLSRILCEREAGSSQHMVLVVATDGLLYSFSLNKDDYTDDVFCCKNENGELVPCSLLILDKMMECYKEYFENGVGWKDSNGELIESDRSSHECLSGFDAAK